MSNYLLDYYIKTYRPDCDTADLKKGQENRLKPLIKKLTDRNSVYKYFPYEILSLDEQAKLLLYILEKSPERQIVANMQKSDADRDYYNFIITDEENEKFTKDFFDELENYEPWNIENEKYRNRGIIRNNINDTEDVFAVLIHINEVIVRVIIDEIHNFLILGLKFENMQYIRDYINYSADGLLQMLIYRIITDWKNVNKNKIINELIDELKSIDERVEFQLQRKNEEYKKFDNLTAEKITRYFTFYRTHYSKLCEEMKIFDVLKLEIQNDKKLFCNLQDKYKVKKIIIPEDEIYKLEEVITEGNSIYGFKEKIKETQKIIDVMNIYGKRDCNSRCIQDIKVYFREIFMSKQKYKGKQTAAIVKEYLSMINSKGISSFEKEGHYMFFREKLNRGYFREKDLLDLYLLKADFQKALFNLLLKTYLFYDFQDSIEFIYEINRCMLLKMKKELLNEE